MGSAGARFIDGESPLGLIVARSCIFWHITFSRVFAGIARENRLRFVSKFGLKGTVPGKDGDQLEAEKGG